MRKTYSRPFKRWDKARIIYESQLMKKYGLKNKREIWKAAAIIRSFRHMARSLFATQDEHAKQELFRKLKKFGILRVKNPTLDDVLGLTVEDLLERRLQTIVYRKGLAKTPKHARQLIVHRHVAIGDKIVTVPSYLVSVEEEKKVRLVDIEPPKVEEQVSGDGEEKA